MEAARGMEVEKRQSEDQALGPPPARGEKSHFFASQSGPAAGSYWAHLAHCFSRRVAQQAAEHSPNPPPGLRPMNPTRPGQGPVTLHSHPPPPSFSVHKSAHH